MKKQFSIPQRIKLGVRPCQMPVTSQVATDATYTGSRFPKLPNRARAALLSRSMGALTEMG